MSACPSCGAHAARLVHAVPEAPVTCTSVFATAEEARAVPAGRIELAACRQCGFAWNAAFDAGIAELGALYESSQAASAHFARFAAGLAADWVARHGLRGGTVLEVGCGDGSFLRAMLEAGAARGIGIDPIAAAGRHAGDTRLTFLAEPFGPAHEALEADALVCRHTLEHVPDPQALLAAVRRWAARRPGRPVLFELPGSEALIEQRAFWDVYYEHCNYYTAPTLRRAFARAGLSVQRCTHVYDGQYLLVEAVAAEARAAEPAAGDAADEVTQWARFGAAARGAIDACRHGFETLARDGPLAIWQGAAKTVGVLTACGNDARVACAVDLNPARHGRYLPGSGLAVRAPEALAALRPAHVVLMNPVYRDEVRSLLQPLAPGARLWTINDLFGGALPART